MARLSREIPSRTASLTVLAALAFLALLLAPAAQAATPSSCLARFGGSVVDADGDPVPDATVRGPGGASWSTDSDGRFLGTDELPCGAHRVVLTAFLEHPGIQGGAAGDAQPVPILRDTSAYTVNFVLDVDQDAIPTGSWSIGSELFIWFVQGALWLGGAYLVTGGFRLRPHPLDDPDRRTSFERVPQSAGPESWQPPRAAATSFTIVERPTGDGHPRD